MRLRVWTILLGLVALFAAGCGGGGSSGGGLTRSLGLFATDGATPSYDHVWVTLKQVVFDSTTKGAVVAYDNAAGEQIDLKTLRDSSNNQLFALLGSLNVPVDTYSDVKVVLDKSLTLVPSGQTTGQAGVFANFDAGTNTKTLTFTFPSPKQLTSDFAIDFDLSQWQFNTSASPIVVTAVIHESDRQGIEDHCVNEAFRGTIGNLAGTPPSQTFTFTSNEGFSLSVQTSASTALYISDGSANPALANGQHVVLKGTLDTTTHVFTASAILILVGTPPSEQHAEGAPSSGDATAGTFTLTPKEVEGFIPTGTTITIATNTNTKFFSGSGASISQSDFFGALGNATNVEVNGSFDANSQTLTAWSVRIEAAEHDNFSAAFGAASNGNVGALTFDLQVNAFEGMNIVLGSTIHVQATNTTVFVGPDGATIDAATFFGDLSTANSVGVQGTYDPGTQTLTAIRAKVNTQALGFFSAVQGTFSNVDTTAHTFTITAHSWEDCDLSFGATVNVSIGDSAVFKDSGGNVITQDQFFTALSSAHVVRVAGTLSSSAGQINLSAKYLKIVE